VVQFCSATQSVLQNIVEADTWRHLVVAQGNSAAAKNWDIVRGRTTATQIAEGQRL
jgi:hypothetical protein